MRKALRLLVLAMLSFGFAGLPGPALVQADVPRLVIFEGFYSNG